MAFKMIVRYQPPEPRVYNELNRPRMVFIEVKTAGREAYRASARQDGRVRDYGSRRVVAHSIEEEVVNPTRRHRGAASA